MKVKVKKDENHGDDENNKEDENNDEDENVDDYIYLPQWIRLSNGRTMKLKTKPLILRMYSYPKDPVQMKYSELLLFTAWRNEETFWQDDDDDKKLLSSDDPKFEAKIQKLYMNVQFVQRHLKNII